MALALRLLGAVTTLVALAAAHSVVRAALPTGGTPTHVAAPVTQPCPAGLPAPWRCATLSVPLDPSGHASGRIRLALALRHRPGPPRPAVLAFAGGPGSAALPAATSFAARLRPLLAHRDLLVVDQRGTGASAPLSCPTIEEAPAWSPAAVRACVARLGRARAFAGTDAVISDFEAVRAALHIPRLTLYGISYGTKVAVDYARADRRHVDAMVLDSPIVEDTDPFYRRSAVGAARVLENQCDEGHCVPGADPVRDLDALVAQMRRGVLPADHRVTEGRILHRIVKGGPRLHALPGLLHSAASGDPGPLAASLPAVVPDARDPSWLRHSFLSTVYLATSCEDGDFPWPRRANEAVRLADARRALDRLGDAAFAPFDRWAGVQYGAAGICAPWPEAARRPAPPPVPDVPALLLVGGDDDVAPLEGAREIAAGLPRARTVVVPAAGHGVLGTTGRAARALRSFAGTLPR